MQAQKQPLPRQFKSWLAFYKEFLNTTGKMADENTMVSISDINTPEGIYIEPISELSEAFREENLYTFKEVRDNAVQEVLEFSTKIGDPSQLLHQIYMVRNYAPMQEDPNIDALHNFVLLLKELIGVETF